MNIITLHDMSKVSISSFSPRFKDDNSLEKLAKRAETVKRKGEEAKRSWLRD